MKKQLIPIAIIVLFPVLLWIIFPPGRSIVPVTGQAVSLFWTPFVRLLAALVLLVFIAIAWIKLVFQLKSWRKYLLMYFVFLLGVFGLFVVDAIKAKGISSTAADGKLFILFTWAETDYGFLSNSPGQYYRDIYSCEALVCRAESAEHLSSVSLDTPFQLVYNNEDGLIELHNVETGAVVFNAGNSEENVLFSDALQTIIPKNADELEVIKRVDFDGLVDFLWIDERQMLVYDGQAVWLYDFNQSPLNPYVVYRSEARSLTKRLLFMPDRRVVLLYNETVSMVDVFTGETIANQTYDYMGLNTRQFEFGFLTTFAEGNIGIRTRGSSDGEILVVSYLGDVREIMIPSIHPPTDILGSRDGSHILALVARSGDNNLYLLDGQSLELLMEYSFFGSHAGIGMNDEGSLLFLSSYVGTPMSEPARIDLEVLLMEDELQRLTDLQIDEIPRNADETQYSYYHPIGLSYDEKLLAVGTETGIIFLAVPGDEE